MNTRIPVSVIELPMFTAATAKYMDSDEIGELTDFIAYNPEAGVIIPGTGGVRKLRWAAKGKGKRGGSRVVYFYLDDEFPIFLVFAYPKNLKADLTQKEKKELKEFTDGIKQRKKNWQPRSVRGH